MISRLQGVTAGALSAEARAPTMRRRNMQLVSPNTPEAAALSEEAKNALEARLHRDFRTYSQAEIDRVSGLNFRLFPKDYALGEEGTRELRALAALSQCELKDPREISSHRPFIGPVIVTTKRLLWRIMRVFLQDSFRGLQEFNSWMLFSHAKLLHRVDELEKELQQRSSEFPKQSFSG